jgi:GT2 family glycosyltransferase
MSSIESARRGLNYSIVIASYRRPRLLRQTVGELVAQVDDDGELLIVEQAPQVDLSAHFRSLSRVRHLVLPRAGSCEARNQGVRLARGEITVFLDDDVIPGKGLIREHLLPYLDPTVGGVAGRSIEHGLEPANDIDPRALDSVTGWWYEHFDHPRPRDVAHAPSKNLSFRTDLIRKAGGFDPAFRLAWREDSDLCFRVRQLGYRIVYHPAAMLTHLHATEGGTRGGRPRGLVRGELQMYARHFRHYRDNLYFLAKHFHGRARRRWIWESYRRYVGLSRWPWRLVAKNACFASAWLQAAGLARYRRHHPCRLHESGETTSDVNQLDQQGVSCA